MELMKMNQEYIKKLQKKICELNEIFKNTN